MSNKLKDEQSPYLKRHSTNPVDWYPWGREAFEVARRDDKAIFLFIGHDDCPDCDRMARESFNDSEVAKLLNEAFVCIMADRVQHPELDTAYTAACKVFNGSAGWPLTVILDHDRRPFFGGTYYPKKTRAGNPGLIDIIPRVRYLWLNSRADLERAAQEIVGAMGQELPEIA